MASIEYVLGETRLKVTAGGEEFRRSPCPRLRPGPGHGDSKLTVAGAQARWFFHLIRNCGRAGAKTSAKVLARCWFLQVQCRLVMCSRLATFAHENALKASASEHRLQVSYPQLLPTASFSGSREMKTDPRLFRMRTLRYSINVTLDGCCDHRAISADEDLHRHELEASHRVKAARRAAIDVNGCCRSSPAEHRGRGGAGRGGGKWESDPGAGAQRLAGRRHQPRHNDRFVPSRGGVAGGRDGGG
jgi:hypothetical protein